MIKNAWYRTRQIDWKEINFYDSTNGTRLNSNFWREELVNLSKIKFIGVDTRFQNFQMLRAGNKTPTNIYDDIQTPTMLSMGKRISTLLQWTYTRSIALATIQDEEQHLAEV